MNGAEQRLSGFKDELVFSIGITGLVGSDEITYHCNSVIAKS